MLGGATSLSHRHVVMITGDGAWQLRAQRCGIGTSWTFIAMETEV
jgi:TPP-dependent 2-oxoacid decarboxylase